MNHPLKTNEGLKESAVLITFEAESGTSHSALDDIFFSRLSVAML